MDVVVSPVVLAVVAALLTALMTALVSMVGVIAYLYRQVLSERDRLLEERDGRLIDLWKDLEERDQRIAALEQCCARLEAQVDRAISGWRDALAGRRTERVRTGDGA